MLPSRMKLAGEEDSGLGRRSLINAVPPGGAVAGPQFDARLRPSTGEEQAIVQHSQGHIRIPRDDRCLSDRHSALSGRIRSPQTVRQMEVPQSVHCRQIRGAVVAEVLQAPNGNPVACSKGMAAILLVDLEAHGRSGYRERPKHCDGLADGAEPEEYKSKDVVNSLTTSGT
jgi:hypothetical protein